MTSRRTLLAGGLAAWVGLVTALHRGVNRRPAGAAATARLLEVGGLPVT